MRSPLVNDDVTHTANSTLTCVLLWVMMNVHAKELRPCLDTCSMCAVERLSTARSQLARPQEVIACQIVVDLHRSDAIAFCVPSAMVYCSLMKTPSTLAAATIQMKEPSFLSRRLYD